MEGDEEEDGSSKSWALSAVASGSPGSRRGTCSPRSLTDD